MTLVNGIINQALLKGGELYYQNGANTMVTTSLGFVRAGTVPFDKRISKDEKNQAIIWSISSALLSLGVQATVYKLLKPVLSDISIKNLGFDKEFGRELKQLERHLPIEELEKIIKPYDKDIRVALKGKMSDTKVAKLLKYDNNTVLNTLAKTLSEEEYKELLNKKPAKQLLAQVIDRVKQSIVQKYKKPTAKIKFYDSAHKYFGKSVTRDGLIINITQGIEHLVKSVAGNKLVTTEIINKTMNRAKSFKGGTQFLTYVFGVALFTGYLIPSFVCKNLRRVLDKMDQKQKAKAAKKSGVPIVETQQQPAERLHNRGEVFKYFGLPIICAGAALAALRHPEKLGKTISGGIKHTFSKLANWDRNLTSSNRVSRNILTNLVLRPMSAIMQGKPFLAAYSVIMEALSGTSLMLSEKILGSSKNMNGLFGKVAKVAKIKDPIKLKGLDFFLKHFLQTYLLLGIGMGFATNKLSKVLSDKIKDVTGANSIEEGTNNAQKLAFSVPTTNIRDSVYWSNNTGGRQIKTNLVYSYIEKKMLANNPR